MKNLTRIPSNLILRHNNLTRQGIFGVGNRMVHYTDAPYNLQRKSKGKSVIYAGVHVYMHSVESKCKLPTESTFVGMLIKQNIKWCWRESFKQQANSILNFISGLFWGEGGAKLNILEGELQGYAESPLGPPSFSKFLDLPTLQRQLTRLNHLTLTWKLY